MVHPYIKPKLWEDILFKHSQKAMAIEQINWLCDPALCSFIAIESKKGTDENLLVLVRTIFLINSICQQVLAKERNSLHINYQTLLDQWTLDVADIKERSNVSGKYIPTAKQVASLKLIYSKLLSLVESVPEGVCTIAWRAACAETKAIFGRSN